MCKRHVHGDAILVISQVNGDWKTKDPKLVPNHECLLKLIEHFGEIFFTFMSNGARPGVGIGDLFAGDGPYVHAAEAFLSSDCARCGAPTDRNAMLHEDAYYCAPCWARVSGRPLIDPSTT